MYLIQTLALPMAISILALHTSGNWKVGVGVAMFLGHTLRVHREAKCKK